MHDIIGPDFGCEIAFVDISVRPSGDEHGGDMVARLKGVMVIHLIEEISPGPDTLLLGRETHL